jgi:antitoxin (DNA-binding transcriptional repressor) of toxin-antitoxin stability system
MALDITVETAERELRGVLERLQPGDTVKLLDASGQAVALLISLKPCAQRKSGASDWRARWDALTERVSRDWKSEKSALEILAEMRR